MSPLGEAALGPPGGDPPRGGRLAVFEDDVLYALASVSLVLFAGLMSGLSLGLMSIDKVELEVLKESGTESEKKCARSIMPVVENQHFTLVTLLLCNAAALEALPLFLDDLTDPVTAVILSVTVVLLVGEIIPQAVCAKYGLFVGGRCAWLVIALRVLTAPVSWPLAKLLDWVMGPNKTVLFKRAQLKAYVSLLDQDRGISKDEVAVIIGALDMQKKSAIEGMTPWDKVFMLSEDTALDENVLWDILGKGHSRIPVHRSGDRKDILGLVIVKELVLINPTRRKKVSDCHMRSIPRLPANAPMYDLLTLFRAGRSHMAVLCEPPKSTGSDSPDKSLALGDPLGIITLEDVIEELLQGEIVDETDKFVDNTQTQKVQTALLLARLPQNVKELLRFTRARSFADHSSKFRWLTRSTTATSLPFGSDAARTPLLQSLEGIGNPGLSPSDNGDPLGDASYS